MINFLNFFKKKKSLDDQLLDSQQTKKIMYFNEHNELIISYIPVHMNIIDTNTLKSSNMKKIITHIKTRTNTISSNSYDSSIYTIASK